MGTQSNGAKCSALASKGAGHSAIDYVEHLDALREFRYQAEFGWFARTQFILTPVAPAPAWDIADPYPPMIAGQKAGPRACSVFATVVNAAGLPALSVPAGLSRSGLPIGVQIIGPRGSDAALLALGEQLESRLKNTRR